MTLFKNNYCDALIYLRCNAGVLVGLLDQSLPAVVVVIVLLSERCCTLLTPARRIFAALPLVVVVVAFASLSKCDFGAR